MPRKAKLHLYEGQWLPLDEIADRKGVTTSTLSRWLKKGRSLEAEPRWRSVAEIAKRKGISKEAVRQKKAAGCLDDVPDFDPHALLDRRSDRYPKGLVEDAKAAMDGGHLLGKGLLGTRAEREVRNPDQPKRLRRALTLLYRWADAMPNTLALKVALYTMHLARGRRHDEAYSWIYLAVVNAKLGQNFSEPLRRGIEASGVCQGCHAHAVHAESICARHSGQPERAWRLCHEALSLAVEGQFAMFKTHRLALLADAGHWPELRLNAQDALSCVDSRYEQNLGGHALIYLALAFARDPTSIEEIGEGLQTLEAATAKFEHATEELLRVNIQWVEALLLGAKGHRHTALLRLRKVHHDLQRIGESKRARIAEFDLSCIDLMRSEDPWATLAGRHEPWVDRVRGAAARGKTELLRAFKKCREELAAGIDGIPPFPIWAVMPSG